MTRQEAKAQGLTHYFTGKPCLRGHLSERFVGDGNCCQCRLERKQIPEVKAKAAARSQRPDVKARKAARSQQPTAKAKAAERMVKYRQANRVELAAKKAAYRKANPHLVNALDAKRRAQKLQQTPRWVDFTAIKAIYEQCAEKTKDTGIKHAVDHIYPLTSTEVCGLHVAANLQIITALENSRKNNRMPAPEQVPSDLE